MQTRWREIYDAEQKKGGKMDADRTNPARLLRPRHHPLAGDGRRPRGRKRLGGNHRARHRAWRRVRYEPHAACQRRGQGDAHHPHRHDGDRGHDDRLRTRRRQEVHLAGHARRRTRAELRRVSARHGRMEHGGSRSAVRRRRAVQAEDHRRQRHRRRGAGRSGHDPRRFRQPLPRQGHHARRGQHHALLPAASCHPHCRTGDVGADDEVHDGRQDAVPHQHDAQDGLLHVPHDELDQVHACPDGRIPVARHEGGRQLHGGRRRPHLGSGELHRAGMLQNVRGDLLADGERRLDVGMARDEDHHRLAESWASDHRHHRLGRARLLPLYGRARNHDGLHRVLHDGAFDHSVSLLRHDE